MNIRSYISNQQGQGYYFYLVALLMGAVFGLLILYPANEFVSYFELPHRDIGLFQYIGRQVNEEFMGDTPLKSLYYAVLGAALGFIQFKIYNLLRNRTTRLQQLEEELGRDIATIIDKGESATLEFKSTLRWDIKQARVNKAVEHAVLKTLAAYLNSGGGTLLIGVRDDGSVYGLEADYQTLRHKNRDGFDQAIMTSVAANLGTEVCQYLQLIFHEVNGRDICRIVVSGSPRPVFLKYGGEVRFYVRAGAGTRELDVRAALNYRAGHWNG